MNEIKRESFTMGFLKYILPVLIVFAATTLAVLMFLSKKKPAEREVERIIPKVDWVEVHRANVELSVMSQGVVSARRSTMLISEVSGVVDWVSLALYAGAFFKEGELLLNIDPTDYLAAVANARSLLAQMQLLYQQELALSAQAQKDWIDMGEGEPTDLVLRKPQLAKAQADLAFAEATLRQAQRNLSYTEVKAPYEGRVKEKFVDVGQSVAAKSSQLASIYSVDAAEIRVSLTQQEAAFVALPEMYVDAALETPTPRVSVVAEYAGKVFEWKGILDRTEGTIDARTRLIYAIVKVDDPYGTAEGMDRPPLKVGMFVKTRIEGRVLTDAITIPRGALNPGDLVHVVNANNRLEIRSVGVVKRDLKTIVIDSGLQDGDRVVITPLSSVSEGMALAPVDYDNIPSTPESSQ